MNPSYNAGGNLNSAGNSGLVSGGFSGSGGGVVSSGGTSRKSSKKILILAGVVAVVLVVAIVVVMIMQGNVSNAPANNTGTTENQNVSNSSSSSYQYTGDDKEFYQYANYLLNGERGVSNGLDLGTYNANVEYAISKAMSEDNVVFMKQAVTLWKSFYTVFSKAVDSGAFDGLVANSTDSTGSASSEVSKNSFFNKLVENIEIQNVQMDFLEKYAGLTIRSEQDLWQLYKKDKNLNTAISNAKKDYNDFSKSASSSVVKWAQAKTAEMEAALRLYAKYDELGCIKNGEYDKDCIEANVTTLEELMKNYVKLAVEAESGDIKMKDFPKGLAEGCFKIRDGLGELNKAVDSGEKDG